jgi:hypothetical protein
MSRSRVRVCLQDGLRLDLNRLARKGFIKFGTNIGPRGIAWTNSYWGVVYGVISADMSNQDDAWLRIQIGDSIQQITLVWRSRHFGGRQWFFVCPATGRLVTVLWKPPGASRFCSRQGWGRRVAYASQFLDRDGRAHHGQSKISSRLCSIGQFDPMIGIFRRSQRGCGGGRTIAMNTSSITTKRSWTAGSRVWPQNWAD